MNDPQRLLSKVNTTDPTNVFSAWGLLDDHTNQGIGISFNSYTPYYSNSTAMIYGGGLNDDGCWLSNGKSW